VRGLIFWLIRQIGWVEVLMTSEYEAEV